MVRLVHCLGGWTQLPERNLLEFPSSFLRSALDHPMPEPDPKDSDPFGPPAIPTMVGCLHCGEEYDSYTIDWRTFTSDDGKTQGFWCCPTPGCDGKGFGFDILPTDPDYQDENGGWVRDGDDEDDDDDDEEFDDGDDDEFDLDESNDFNDLLEPPPRGENGTGKPKEDDDDDLPW